VSANTDRDIMTIEEAAELLRVSIKTFNKVLHTESIPARKVGREWKFSRQALIQWIGDGRSDEFYRDSSNGSRRGGTRRAGEIEPAGRGDASSKRRTSGWRLEID
jgi:excisionase family DNA binding protein